MKKRVKKYRPTKKLKGIFHQLLLSPDILRDYPKYLEHNKELFHLLVDYQDYNRQKLAKHASQTYDEILYYDDLYGVKATAIIHHIDNFPTLHKLQCNRFLPYIKGVYEPGGCVICISEFDEETIVYELNCRHSFHIPCIRNWFNVQNNCPCCRNKVSGCLQFFYSYKTEQLENGDLIYRVEIISDHDKH
ncbi:hypothetical protein HELRODRAFT_89788 [Helobdella robusta]|uniref:RING-type domain-containing protein n=1 Tax=Helobdella robusta TaxID=6412 RepID=T1G7H7_HELRO|nr:hypothetical protein HELRODRAFT_89788 [Helobdella robusta]ESN92219.1 hypothetical protein HELRODRAFT_89788 [Helobdella robusta]